jgi:hypothetical protein
MKALDTSAKTNGMAQQIAHDGYKAVGVYLRSDRCSAAIISELKAAILQLWSIYENGYPTSDVYFSKQRGTSDGQAAAKFARQMINQPTDTKIYATVDYDPDDRDPNGPTIRGPISAYFAAFKAEIEPAGYVAGVYGSGRTCRILIETGLATSGWVCQSTSFAEHAEFTPSAAIVQKPRINKSWDGDEVQNPELAGLW